MSRRLLMCSLDQVLLRVLVRNSELYSQNGDATNRKRVIKCYIFLFCQLFPLGPYIIIGIYVIFVLICSFIICMYQL